MSKERKTRAQIDFIAHKVGDVWRVEAFGRPLALTFKTREEAEEFVRREEAYANGEGAPDPIRVS